MKLGVTFSPPATALSNVTVKVSASPSLAEASATVTAALSSSVMVPVAVSVALTNVDVPETDRLTVKVSPASTTASWVVSTVKLCCSPVVPVKVSAEVFSV